MRKTAGRKLKLLVQFNASTSFSSLLAQAPSGATVHQGEHTYIVQVHSHAHRLTWAITHTQGDLPLHAEYRSFA